MSIATWEKWSTFADLRAYLDSLDGIAADRVVLSPPPGSATEQDVLDAEKRSGRPICELIDGVLVEKAMGFVESILAALLITRLNEYVLPRKLGVVTAPDGCLRLGAGLVRAPDVAFYSWKRIGPSLPQTPIPSLVPDLAVEILSDSNTEKEMRRKRRDYFSAGVGLVWEIDHRDRRADVYASPDEFERRLDFIDGGEMLPGFTLELANLFDAVDGEIER